MYLYRSNLTCPDLRPCFPFAEEFTVGFEHTILRDPQIDKGCGYVSFEEAAIIHETAYRTGGEWVEIGSHTGWSGAHIAVASPVTRLLMIEPRLRERDFFSRWYGNIERVRSWCRRERGRDCAMFQPYAGRSDEYSVCGDQDMFDGGFIDGDHNAPVPELDAQRVLAKLKPRGVIAFHDFTGGPVQVAVKALMAAGLKCRIYDTPQMVAVCWRGDFEPPDHVPDPQHRVAYAKRRASHDFPYADCV